MLELTKTDLLAIENHDDEYLLNKGVDYYKEGDYKTSFEYYQIAANLGNPIAICNLGHYYYDGLGVEKNSSLSFGYLLMAAKMGDIHATYLLGRFYKTGEIVEKDDELGFYYLNSALDMIDDSDDEYFAYQFPSLFHFVASDILSQEVVDDLDYYQAYDYLMNAKKGYEIRLLQGIDSADDDLKEVEKLLEAEIFDEIREEYQEDENFEHHSCHCHCDEE